MKKLVCLVLLMSGFSMAADAILIQDQINFIDAQHAMLLRNRVLQDANYAKERTKLQGALEEAQASPSPSPSPR